jgi:RNA polymerase sigma-70 factor (ECF subfamily)
MTLSACTDEDLMLQVQQGDEQAYSELFARHKRSVFGYTSRFIRDEARAQEVFQDTWLKVHRSRHTYRQGARFKTWLFTIAANTTRDAYRSSQRRIQTVDSPVEARSANHRPSDHADLHTAIEGLPDSLREAFYMGAVQGFDHNEVAEALGISPANARARISRARAQLREILKGDA